MSEAPAQGQASILLVDDKPARLLSYEAILEPLGQHLVRAQSGEEGLARMREIEFAAILLDVNMPGLDGFETARRVRCDPDFGQTPIIFVTGVHITDLDQLRGYEIGAADYVYVPVVPEILRAKVQVLVQLYQQRRDLARLNQRLAVTNAELARAHARLQAENTRELQRLNQTLERANAQLVSEVAERKHAETLLKDAAQRKDEFISILAHELRNPLAAMQSGLELLSGNLLPENKVPWAHALLERQLKHLKRLIDDLLDVSRITSGRVQVRREPLQLETVIAHSVDAARSLIDERRHELSVELPAQPLHVNGDPVRLAQVFGNLLTNAAKFTGDGGAITLAAELEADCPGWVRVRVRDTGQGIAEDMLERVFDLFAQVDAADSRAQAGLGIGLALSRGLIELHGGSIEARSPGHGMGSEFVVRLPLGTPLPETDTPEPPSADMVALASAPTLRLLIIDDNEDFAHGLAIYLTETSGHEVLLANSGHSGIDAARSFKPDVVLLDIGLPDIDGYEVARHLREPPGSHRLPLIAISGFGSEAHRRRAQHAGFDRYFVKPVEYEVLKDALSEHCPATG
jgi:signal transduction histidine kinase